MKIKLSRILVMLYIICCVFSQSPSILATELSSSETIGTIETGLSSDSVPECLSYEVAVESGHTQRLYNEE